MRTKLAELVDNQMKSYDSDFRVHYLRFAWQGEAIAQKPQGDDE